MERKSMVDRVIIMVLDGFGVGEAPDANKYGDEGSNTLAGIYNNTSLNIPNMAKLQGRPCALGRRLRGALRGEQQAQFS